MRRALAIAAFGLALGVAGATAAEDAEPAAETEIDEVLPAEANGVDRAHAAMSRRVIDAGKRLDAFFSDQRVEEEVSGSRIRLRGGIELRSGPDVDLLESIDAKIALPRTEQRFQLLLGRVGVRNQEDDDLLSDRERESEYLTGLRVLLRDNTWLRLQADGGSKFRPLPDPFTRLRVRLLHEVDPWAFRLAETGFWYTRDGYGQTTRADVDRILGERFFVRATGEATISEKSDGVEWGHRLSVQRVLSPRRAISFDVEASGRTRPTTVVEEYETSLRYRQRIWRRWLFYEVEPAIVFPRERGYEARPEIAFRLELVLGDLD